MCTCCWQSENVWLQLFVFIALKHSWLRQLTVLLLSLLPMIWLSIRLADVKQTITPKKLYADKLNGRCLKHGNCDLVCKFFTNLLRGFFLSYSFKILFILFDFVCVSRTLCNPVMHNKPSSACGPLRSLFEKLPQLIIIDFTCWVSRLRHINHHKQWTKCLLSQMKLRELLKNCSNQHFLARPRRHNILPQQVKIFHNTAELHCAIPPSIIQHVPLWNKPSFTNHVH